MNIRIGPFLLWITLLWLFITQILSVTADKNVTIAFGSVGLILCFITGLGILYKRPDIW
jgi:hypothetical protein